MTENQAPLTLGYVWEAVRHHKWRFAISFGLVMACVAAALLILPKQYGSEGKLYVQLGRYSIGLDPTATTSGTISVTDTRDMEIRSVVTLLRSESVLGRVVDRVGVERILQDDLAWPAWLSPSLPGQVKAEEAPGGLAPSELEAHRVREKAIRRLQKSVTIDNDKGTSVVSVFCKANSPFLARAIVQSILDVYSELHVSVNTIKSRSFFERQFETEQEKLDEAIGELEAFRNRRKFLSVEGARSTLQQVLDRLQLSRVEVSVDLAEANERIAKLMTEMNSISRRLERPTVGVERSSAEGGKSELLRLESELAKLKASKQDDHPQVSQLQSQVDQLRSAIESRPQDRTVTVQDYNPVYEQLQISLVQSRANANALKQRLATIDEKFEQAQRDLVRLNEDEKVSTQLQRNIDIARNYVNTFATKRGEARILDRLDREQISNVVVAQQATLWLKHIAPRGSVVVPLGGLLALLLATVVAVIAQRRRREIAIETESNPEEHLELPVLVTIPRVSPTQVTIGK